MIVLYFTFRCVFLCSLLEIRYIIMSIALRLTGLYAIIYVSCTIRLMSKSEKTTLENVLCFKILSEIIPVIS